MQKKQISFQVKIFFLIIVLFLIVFGVVFYLTANYHKKTMDNYVKKELKKKQESLFKAIKYKIQKESIKNNSDFKKENLEQWLQELRDIHQIDITLYDLNGKYVSGTIPEKLENIKKLNSEILKKVDKCQKLEEKINLQNGIYLSIYFHIKNKNAEKIDVANMYFFKDNTKLENYFKKFYKELFGILFICFIGGMFLAYYFSNHITRPLKAFIQKIQNVNLDKKNEKINFQKAPLEIVKLSESYNLMLDTLEKNLEKISQNERNKTSLQVARQMAHEIKNPLTPMRLYLQKMQMQKEITKEALQNFTNTFLQQIDTINTTLNKFSEYMNIDKKKDVSVEVIAFLKNIVAIFQNKNIAFQTDFKEMYLKVDEELLNRLFINLIKNAIEATENIKKPSIKIILKQKEKEVFFEIWDNGKGIPEAIKNRIFDVYFTSKSKGSGFGLFIVKKIMDAYGGKISFESKEGAGATFFVSFPKQNKASI